MIRSVIAIGSNSTRMLTAEVCPGTVSVLHRDRIETSLFLGLDRKHNLSDEAIGKVCEAVGVLKLRSSCYGSGGRIALLATSAVRDALNKKDLSDRILHDCGLDMEILSGNEEARLAFIAASLGRTCTVADIGGGSTEIICGNAGVPDTEISLQLGASRLMRLRPIRGISDANELIGYAKALIAEHLPSLPSGQNDCFVGIGGTLTTLACIHHGIGNLNADREYTVSADSMTAWLNRLADMSLPERAAVPGMPPGREKHIVHGLCILRALCEHFGFGHICISFRTNMDGYLIREAGAQDGSMSLPTTFFPDAGILRRGGE